MEMRSQLSSGVRPQQTLNMRGIGQFQPGDRVRVEDPLFPTFWANGSRGTVSEPPGYLLDFADGWSGHVRTVPTTSGPQPYYWVMLDEPRLDGDGDGPYAEAEIAGRSLHRLVESTSPEA